MLVDLHTHCLGSEHKKQNKPLQDFSDTYLNKTKTFAAAFVADGHGGEKYIRSAQGSQIAVDCAKKQLIAALTREFQVLIKAKKLEAIEKTLKNLCSKILTDWRTETKRHYKENLLSEDEKQKLLELKFTVSDESVYTLYGTTLLIAAYFEQYGFWFALQIGDGKCVAFRDDAELPTVFYPIEEDERLGFGVTTSLCSNQAVDDFRCNCGFEKLAGIVVMTDGMADSFETEKLPEFILNIRRNAIENKEVTKKELENFLPKLSEQGSGDDISIAAIFAKKKPNINASNEEVKHILKEVKENVNSKLENVSKEVEKKLESICESR
ncbi:MAG: protein phosphatase 2C domain-containing protein [Treponema sp.]|nr:protein phosphatase 2C domain-containing protein [Treponema sp.]